MRGSGLDDVSHLRFEIGHGQLHAREVPVIFFGDLDAMSFAEFHDDIEEIHAVEFELFAETDVINQIVQVLVRCDVTEDVDDLVANFGGTHGRGVLRLADQSWWKGNVNLSKLGCRAEGMVFDNVRQFCRSDCWGWSVRVGWAVRFGSDAANDHHRIDPQHAERVIEDVVDAGDFAGFCGYQAREVAFGVEVIDIDRRVDDAVAERGEVSGEFKGSGGPHRVSDEAFGVIDPDRFAFAEDAAQRDAFLGIAAAGPGGVGADDVDILGFESGAAECELDALGLTFWIGEDEVGGVGIDRVAGEFAVDFGAAAFGVAEAFEDVDAAPFGDDDAVTIAIERAAGSGRVGVGCEGVLAVEAREDPEGVDAFASPAGERDIALIEPQHLGPLDDAGVASGAGRADGVVRSGDPEIQGDFAGGVVGDGAWVVVMGPDGGVVIEPFDLVDLIFGFDVTVFGDTNVDADAGAVDVLPIEAAVADRFVGGVDADAAGAGAAAEVFFGLVAEGIEIANAGEGAAEIANFVIADAAAIFEERLAERMPVIAVWRSQADTGDDDSLGIGERFDSGGDDHDESKAQETRKRRGTKGVPKTPEN